MEVSGRALGTAIGVVVLASIQFACAATRVQGDQSASTPAALEVSADRLRAELDARGRAYSAAVVRASASGWAAPQVDSLAAFYTDSTILFPPKGDPIRGRDAIRQYWTRSPDRKILAHAIRIERVDVGTSADLAADHGRVELTAQQGGAEPTVFRLTYISVWRREADGQWRKHLDSWW
ncbi:MAG TPA: DUF4440 domain-containing protein [Gemmatimonadaceae bacterium]|nr:DUF4440 domain-containing protein [Gemmatimonadaceae bacterium]